MLGCCLGDRQFFENSVFRGMTVYHLMKKLNTHLMSIQLICISIRSKINLGSGSGQVIKLLACGASGPGFNSRSRHLNFRDWISPASTSRYG